jgi:phenylalanyl-tRNA synthetase beta chain
MKFSYNWLKRWVDLDIEASELADRLTASGLEVDGVKSVAGQFEGVVVAAIRSCEPHPDADKLVVCGVDAGGDELLQVVCGAPNARVGLFAPFATIGAHLGEDFKVKKVALRGVESQGMLCSAKELGMGDDHSGLLELSENSTVGQDISEALELNDTQFDIDLTPNRADCLSIRGIARDVSASCEADFTEHPSEQVTPQIEDVLPIRLESPEDCPRYVGRIIRGINPAANTPLWMREALRRCGLRSISPVVDVTNYVLLELGQPMHGFDLSRIEGGITVRRGRAGEELVLLDEQEVKLDESVLAICDDKGPLALGGIMGGLESGVGESTSDVLFEAAWFKPSTIMGKARDYGLHTDASHRFERGVDTDMQVRAMERATQLLMQIAGGVCGPVMVEEVKEHIPNNQAVSLRIARLNHLLGTRLDSEQVIHILNRLDMDIEVQDDGQRVQAVAPASRFDIEIEEDLIEEVARIYGYDNIPEAVPNGELAVGTAVSHAVPMGRILLTLCAAGYQEVINYSFVDPKLLETFGMAEGALPLANPLTSDMAVMRTSLIPGLLSNLARNLRRQHSRVRLFENGVTFFQSDTLIEIERIAGVACGSAHAEQWSSSGREIDFHDVKGDVEAILALRGMEEELHFRAGSREWTHPGASASVVVNRKGNEEVIGWCAVMHPAVLKALEIGQTVVAFELDLDPIRQRAVPFAKTYSRFPSVRRDLALEVPVEVDYESVRECVVESAGALLKNLVLFDVYEGQNLKKGYKSLAIGLILQHVSSTLTDEAIDALVGDTVTELEQRLGARLRG